MGDKENWEIAIENKIWGFTNNSKGFWNTLEVDDLLAFYSTRPIKKIFGFGRVIEKFTDDELLWSDEQVFKRVLWPLRIRFEILFLLENWNAGEELPKLNLRTPRVNIDKKFFLKIVKQMEKKHNIQILKQNSWNN